MLTYNQVGLKITAASGPNALSISALRWNNYLMCVICELTDPNDVTLRQLDVQLLFIFPHINIHNYIVMSSTQKVYSVACSSTRAYINIAIEKQCVYLRNGLLLLQDKSPGGSTLPTINQILGLV